MSKPTAESDLRLKDAIRDDARITLEQERTILTLLSGRTQRWHMHPFMPTQEVADHAWHVAIILALIDPKCTKYHLISALVHDVAELKHGDISAVQKRANKALAKSLDEQESKTIFRWTGHEFKPSPAMKIADKLADYWLLAIQSRLGNQEATSGIAKHREWIDGMDLKDFPAAIMIRDAIERWCMYGSTILREQIT